MTSSRSQAPAQPKIPSPRSQTLRQTLLDLLRSRPHDLRELSKASRLSEKEILSHLESIQKSLNKNEESFHIDPARCIGCGFTFEDRQRFQKPSRCPECKGQRITHPLYHITPRNAS
jgi:predicted Zn-ribbon and HTH transcriptional regulator